jgi:chaperone protein EcpD
MSLHRAARYGCALHFQIIDSREHVMKKNMKKAFLIAALSTLFCAQAAASVVIGATRIVFPSNEREVSVRLTNEGSTPSLIQTWFDKGDANAQPDATPVPFVLTPPLFRLDPAKGQTLRVIHTKEAMPEDRESVYWLNVLEIPPKPKDGEADDSNFMQMAFRIRIKLFYRPKDLNKQVLLDKAPSQVVWKVVADEKAAGYVVEASNPTPYHINFTKVALNINGKEMADEVGGMVEPFGKLRVVVKGLNSQPANAKVTYTLLNDYGASVTEDATLAH